jgi:hypothetical protein
MRRSLSAVLCVALAALLLTTACGKKNAANSGQSSPLYTGKEAKRKVVLSFPARAQTGFVSVEREIYATPSLVNQAKQVLQLLMAGPTEAEKQAAAPFGKDASFRELFLDGQGLAVIDLPTSTAQGLSGGTSAEVATLFSIVRTFTANIQGVGRVQILIDGQPAPSLSGHVDTMDPLTLADF